MQIAVIEKKIMDGMYENVTIKTAITVAITYRN